MQKSQKNPQHKKTYQKQVPQQKQPQKISQEERQNEQKQRQFKTQHKKQTESKLPEDLPGHVKQQQEQEAKQKKPSEKTPLEKQPLHQKMQEMKKKSAQKQSIFERQPGQGTQVCQQKQVIEGKQQSQVRQYKPSTTIQKSVVILDIKPQNEKVHLQKLRDQIAKHVKRDGLTWGEHKIESIGYGINKLVFTCVVENKVSVEDEVIGKILKLEGVKDVDVVAFQKV